MYTQNTKKMDVVKSRYGKDRSIEKLGNNKIRVMGESEFVREAVTDDGDCSMFDFEGGPCYNVGGTIRYQKTNWKIGRNGNYTHKSAPFDSPSCHLCYHGILEGRERHVTCSL